MAKPFFGPYIIYTTDAQAQTGGTAATQPNTATASGQTQADQAGAQTGGTTQPRFTQEELNALLAKERKETERRLKQQAEDDLKVKQGEFQSLAEQKAARVAELEAAKQTTEDRLAAISEAMTRQAEARLKALPAEIKAMAPEGDVLALYTWLEKAETAAQKLTTQKTALAGTNTGPSGTGSGVTGTTNNADLIAEKRARIGGL